MQDLINRAHRGYFFENETWTSLNRGEWLFRAIFSWLPGMGIKSGSVKCLEISLETLFHKPTAPTPSFIASIDIKNPLVAKTIGLVDQLKTKYLKFIEQELLKKKQKKDQDLSFEISQLKQQLQEKDSQIESNKIKIESAEKTGLNRSLLLNGELQEKLKKKEEQLRETAALADAQAKQIFNLNAELEKTRLGLEKLKKQIADLHLLKKENEKLSKNNQSLEETTQELIQQIILLNQQSNAQAQQIQQPQAVQINVNPPLQQPPKENVQEKPAQAPIIASPAKPLQPLGDFPGGLKPEELQEKSPWQAKFEQIKSDVPIPKEFEKMVKIIQNSNGFPLTLAGGIGNKEYAEDLMFHPISERDLLVKLGRKEAAFWAFTMKRPVKMEYSLVFANPQDERVQGFIKWINEEYGCTSSNHYQHYIKNYYPSAKEEAYNKVKKNLTGSGKDPRQTHIQPFRYEVVDDEIFIASDRWVPYFAENQGMQIDNPALKRWQANPYGGFVFGEDLKKTIMNNLIKLLIDQDEIAPN